MTHRFLRLVHLLSLSMGISDEIDDATIAIDEGTILKIEVMIRPRSFFRIIV